MADYALSYTGAQINEKLGQVGVLVASASTSFTGTGLTFYVFKYGNLGFISIASGTTNAALAANATMGTIPAGYRPNATIELLNTYGGGSTAQRIQIATSGIIKCTAALASGSNIRFSSAYIIGG